ncbi:DUF412 family protein [Gallaecimonas xiamenensis]|uniref:UPF0208 membrane protein YfbV n=1 Tax=Gallaecimonas xiamenensis 3-C-1 TaxID=745411 RepID=K2JKA9_9GAMM|nr:DUF412 family protein [Gallaecimonas xiamenensis]EKE70994.1 hypothetical protein B3C1_13399 [Gallaecimonas xiamenensis 3-C-1]
MWDMVRDGYQLLRHWPQKGPLAWRFGLTRTVLLARWLLHWVPGLTLAWLFVALKMAAMPLSGPLLMMALLLLSLPLQAILWLGKEGRKPLSPGDRHWLAELTERMKDQGVTPVAKLEGARYLELALVMDQVAKRGERAFGPTD